MQNIHTMANQIQAKYKKTKKKKQLSTHSILSAYISL